MVNENQTPVEAEKNVAEAVKVSVEVNGNKVNEKKPLEAPEGAATGDISMKPE